LKLRNRYIIYVFSHGGGGGVYRIEINVVGSKSERDRATSGRSVPVACQNVASYTASHSNQSSLNGWQGENGEYITSLQSYFTPFISEGLYRLFKAKSMVCGFLTGLNRHA
jgi:hypothetical protein